VDRDLSGGVLYGLTDEEIEIVEEAIEG